MVLTTKALICKHERHSYTHITARAGHSQHMHACFYQAICHALLMRQRLFMWQRAHMRGISMERNTQTYKHTAPMGPYLQPKRHEKLMV